MSDHPPGAGRAETNGGRLPLEAVVATAELESRGSRPPDFQAENRALHALLAELAAPDGNVLQRLAEAALELCDADSSGVSVLERETGAQRIRWEAAAGQWAVHAGGSIARELSPCGAALERGSVLLFAHPERHFPFEPAIALPIAEALLVPFEVHGEPAGTIWVIAHESGRRFDAEDVRLLTGLSRFAALALQTIAAQEARAELFVRQALDEERQLDLAATRRLQEISTTLIQAGHDESLDRLLVEAASEIMRSDFASFQLLLPESSELLLLANKGFSPEAAEFWKIVRTSSCCTCGVALRRGHRVVVPDVEESSLVAGDDLETYRGAGIAAVQSTPLVSRSGRILGMISTHWRKPHVAGERDFQLFDVLARQAADLIELRRMLEEQRRAEDALKQADRRKDEFLAVLAHELRNPLAPLRNTLRLVRPAGEGAEADAIRSACSLMERQVDHLVRLVDELLDLSRISRGKVTLRKDLVELGPIVQQAVETVRPICESSGAEIEIRLPETPLYLDADPIRLAQALANLLHNACKFSERGGKVRLEAEVADGAEPELVVRVRDEGIGIAPDQISRIFEMFAQVDTSVERSQSGLGIGLTLVRSLVEMHGGTVEARSDGIGKGSEFVVRLPHRKCGAPVQLAAAVAESAPISGRRVLVVDDNRDSAESLAMLLRHLGHTTEVAYDGEHALATAERFRPDVLLLDLGMPRMSGFELCRRIRGADWGDEVLMIAQTGWGQDRDRQRALDAGFDGHLVKPVDHEALLKLLAGPRRAGE